MVREVSRDLAEPVEGLGGGVAELVDGGGAPVVLGEGGERLQGSGGDGGEGGLVGGKRGHGDIGGG